MTRVALAIACAVLLLSMGAIAGSPWVHNDGVATHLPTGLLFPDTLGELRRLPIDPSSNPEMPGVVSVSYGAEPTQVRIILMPSEYDPASEAPAFLEARLRALRSQVPTVRVTDRAKMMASCFDSIVTFYELSVALPLGTHSYYAAHLKGYLLSIESLAVNGSVAAPLPKLANGLGWPCHAAE